MGIYYGTRLYYGRIMRREFYQQHVEGRDLPKGLELFVVNENRIVLSYGMESVDDGVDDRGPFPDYIKKSTLLDINYHLTAGHFEEIQEIRERFTNFIGETPGYYVVCYGYSTYGPDFRLLYNIRVDLNQ